MRPLRNSTFSLRHILQVTFFLSLILGILYYGGFQARNLIDGPEIVLEPELEVEHTDRIISVSGTTENIVELTLNGMPIFTDESGSFNTPLVLPNGYTIMTLRAKDRYGRESVITRSLIYVPSFASK